MSHMEDLRDEKTDKSELYQKLCNFSETFAIDELREKRAEIETIETQIEAFEKDINNIIEIIDGVEKNMCRDKLNN